MIISKLKLMYKKIRRLFYQTRQSSYSQCGEDMIVRFYLNKKRGYYVDIGAYHPIKISNTYHFFKKGWKGINIDGSKEGIDLFKKRRPNDINLNLFIGKDDGKYVDFFVFKNRELNTGKEEALELIKKYHNETPIKKERILMNSLSTVLDKYLPKNQEIDLLNIDVEGLDLEVLTSNNWEKYRPFILLIEDHKSIYDFLDSPIHKYLYNLEYKLGGFSMHSYIFIKDN
jgi:FkbM family methyltransferase